MPTLLLISNQVSIIDKWQALLALDYTIDIAQQFEREACQHYTMVILDAAFIDDKTFDIAVIKQLSSRFLILGKHWSEEQQVEVLVAGAAGYCDYTAPTSVVLKAIESILQGDIWVQRHLITRVIGSLVKLTTHPQSPTPTAKKQRTDLSCLSSRELDVAKLIRQGVCNKDIAAKLFISERTVKAHLTSIFAKLNVSNRLHLSLLLNEVDQ